MAKPLRSNTSSKNKSENRIFFELSDLSYSTQPFYLQSKHDCLESETLTQLNNCN